MLSRSSSVARRGVAAASRLGAAQPPCVPLQHSDRRRSAPSRSAIVGLAAAAGAISCYWNTTVAHSEAESRQVGGNDPWAHTKLYPPTVAHRKGHMKVNDLHTIYYEVHGNPNGKPVLFVHGGPGGGTTPAMARFFDPARYRVVLVDQRGCGKSTPFAELRENTTQDSIEDFEKLRNHLGIDQWQVFGGSWGSTLALAYAVSRASPL